MKNSDRIEQLKRFAEEDPNDSFSRFALALEYMKGNDLQQAAGLFVHILKRDPEYSGAYYHLGKVYELLGRGDDARTTYTKGITVCTRQQDLHAAQELKQALNELEETD